MKISYFYFLLLFLRDLSSVGSKFGNSINTSRLFSSMTTPPRSFRSLGGMEVGTRTFSGGNQIRVVFKEGQEGNGGREW